jgi:serine/alanine adding enzyme
VRIKHLQPDDVVAWDTYVKNHPRGTLYHLSGWKRVTEEGYGHRTFYIMATQNSGDVVGMLPLVHLKHFLFGNNLVSIPFFDLGGVLADDEETEKALLSEAIRLGRELKVTSIELRHTHELGWDAGTLGNPEAQEQKGDKGRQTAGDRQLSAERRAQGAERRAQNAERRAQSADESTPKGVDGHALGAMRLVTKSHKVRMLLDLPASSELLMNSFKSKLKSQIRKPTKEGLSAKIGSIELFDDFYRVFSENMRDLGSPVHSKRLIRSVFEVFPGDAKIAVVYKQDEPTAGSVVIGFKDVLENPWASSLRKYSKLSPNMLLYWSMLDYACERGYKFFDFGRSAPEEGTYKFKEQWGAKPNPLHWHCVLLNGSEGAPSLEKSQFSKMIEYWKKLPVPVTKFVGPMIRKHISL